MFIEELIDKNLTLLVDENKNIAIFPYSRLKERITLLPDGELPILPDGTIEEYSWSLAFYPIELKYPYTNAELAEKILYGYEQYNKHECYPRNSKTTFEEKYYGIRGFKNAMKGKYMVDIWYYMFSSRHEVSLSLPCKRGYAYLGLAKEILPDEADWIDFADAVIKLINIDLTTLSSYKSFKRNLNI